MGPFHAGGNLILPSLFKSCVVHEESGICRNPSFPIKTKATACDDNMNMRMPFHVGTKGMNNDQNAHAHVRNLMGLLETLIARMKFSTGTEGNI